MQCSNLSGFSCIQSFVQLPRVTFPGLGSTSCLLSTKVEPISHDMPRRDFAVFRAHDMQLHATRVATQLTPATGEVDQKSCFTGAACRCSEAAQQGHFVKRSASSACCSTGSLGLFLMHRSCLSLTRSRPTRPHCKEIGMLRAVQLAACVCL